MTVRSDPVVTLHHGGELQGHEQDGAARYLGIPYAAAPVGAHRLRAPAPAPAWTGVRDATRFGPTAPKGPYPEPVQPILPEVDIPGDEWLNLSVWCPATSKRPGPVLVWVHGGSFLNGSNSLPEYDGTAFARDGVVFVSVNYRLGAEGFLTLEDADANRGLRDVIAALAWVQEEIERFGGDPGAVTIAGESAGAMAVGTLLATPAARGLFSRAILHSGAASNALPLERARDTARVFGEQLGVPATREALAALDPARLVDGSLRTFVAMQPAVGDPRLAAFAPRQLPFAPVVDGDLLPADPLASIRGGAGADVDVLLCTTRDEARLFYTPMNALDGIDEALLATAATELYGMTGDEFARYRDLHADRDPGSVLAAIVGDRRFLVPAIALAEARSEAGSPATWLARFDALELEDNDGLGACHATDTPFAFDTVDLSELRPRLGSAPSRAATKALHDAWVRFAHGDDPGWATYQPEADRLTAQFTKEGFTTAADLSSLERRAFA